MNRSTRVVWIARGLVIVTLLLAALWLGNATLRARPAADAPVFLPLVRTAPARLLIAAAHIDSALSGQGDEAVMIWNTGSGAQSLAGWGLATRTRTARFPITTTLTLGAGERLWCAAEAATFQLTFGEAAACEWARDSETTAVDLDNSLTLADAGGLISLLDANGQVMDALLFGDETEPAPGWQGMPAQAYERGDMPSVGQVWQRKADSLTFLPQDNDLASDWSGDLNDLDWGRRVRLPGWGGWSDTDLGRPTTGTAEAAVTVLIGPEGLFHPLSALIDGATATIDLVIYTIEHPDLAQKLADAARRGVQVRLLVEGSPAGGISDLEKWCLATIAAGGGDVRFFAVADHAPTGYRPRYRFVHAKYMLIDDRIAATGTENISDNSFPVEHGAPVGGRRGYYLVTDAAPVLDALRQIFHTDWAPGRFQDIRPFEPGHERYGGPPADFVLPERPVHPVAAAPFGEAQTYTGLARFQVLATPENAWRPDAGLLALIQRAGAGDEILLEQLYEQRNWGLATSNPIADPNPRLAALIEAARRGARIRILLDQFFDEEDAVRNNRSAIDYINAVAATEGLDLQAKQGNPTLGGIHAKLVLARVGAEYWSAVGSLNGGETSFKLNREVVVLTDLAGVHHRLAEVFAWDWTHAE